MAEIDLTGQRLQEELTRNESLRLLASVPLGRVVFTHQALPAIRPVNHIVDGGEIIIRTHAGAAIFAAAQRRVVVAYEADQIDLDRHVGWSVVVVGVARPVVDPPDGAYLAVPQPWVARPMDQLIAISTDLVTGLRLLPAPIEPAEPPAGASAIWRG